MYYTINDIPQPLQDHLKNTLSLIPFVFNYTDELKEYLGTAESVIGNSLIQGIASKFTNYTGVGIDIYEALDSGLIKAVENNDDYMQHAIISLIAYMSINRKTHYANKKGIGMDSKFEAMFRHSYSDHQLALKIDETIERYREAFNLRPNARTLDELAEESKTQLIDW